MIGSILEFLGLISPVLVAILLIAVEVKFDLYRWGQDPPLPDKPLSTRLRCGAMLMYLVAVFIIIGDWQYAIIHFGLMLSTWVLLFDQTINIARWGTIPDRHDYRIKMGIDMTDREQFFYDLQNFIHKLFWHGENKPKWTWDWLFIKIPPVGEFLYKSILFGTACYFYF